MLPSAEIPLTLSRPLGITAVDAALSADNRVLVFTQKEAVNVEPGPEELYPVGTLCTVKNVWRRSRDIDVLLTAGERIRLETVTKGDVYLRAGFTLLPPQQEPDLEARARDPVLLDLAEQLVPALDRRKLEALPLPSRLCTLCSAVHVPIPVQQQMLEADSIGEGMTLLFEELKREKEVSELRQRLKSEAQSGVDAVQKEQLLRQEILNIERELGEDPQDLGKLRARVAEAVLGATAREEAQTQLRQLERMSPTASEYQVTRAYLEFLVDLPWNVSTKDELDLPRARRILDEDHAGLHPVKERILEHLAVMRLNPAAHAPILCFVGPPGTGKTSLGRSIARALGRKFERLSLGGVHDEAEIRGHRRTYVGAMTGRILQAVRRARVNNPLLMLDEVDKMQRSFEGDPAAALLEILDPAQNYAFHDNYLGLPFDLSHVFFITTANTTESIPPALLDRMELLRLSGYTEDEKMQIARRHLLPRQLEETGLDELPLEVPDETLHFLVQRYTREAGVRQLERCLSRVLRRVALRWAEAGHAPRKLTPELVLELLGPEELRIEPAHHELPPGVALGLAFTESGGEVLSVEASRLADGEEMVVTGHVGAVMQESARAAWTYVLSHAQKLGLPEVHGPIHVHVPAGATPKDGPSAGLAIAAALVSAFRQVSLREDTALTGEVTLTGRVLPVGGLKEKLLCAQRYGLKRVLVPADNEPHLGPVLPLLKGELEVVPVHDVEEALRYVYTAQEVPASSSSPRCG